MVLRPAPSGRSPKKRDTIFIVSFFFGTPERIRTAGLPFRSMAYHVIHGSDVTSNIVDEKLRADGVKVNMSYKKAPTNQSKLSRIIQYAPDIKKFYFVDGKHRSSEYEKFIRELPLFTVSGKNLHDDAPDACAMLVDFIGNGVKMVTVARKVF